MTVAEACKAAGLKSLPELVRMTGESKENLTNWYAKRPQRFQILLEWAVNKKREQGGW